MIRPMMVSGLQATLAVVVTLITLASLAGGLYAVFRSSAQDARIKRLQDERDDYLSRLNFIEPKLVQAEQQNQVLRDLHNPAEQIGQLKAQEQDNHDKVVQILNDQTRTLQEAITRSHSA